MSKQVYDLTAADLEREPVWVFPMDESVEDEASVRPVRRGEVVPDGLQRIVRAVFRDGGGRVLSGYIYPGFGSCVEGVRPVAWCNELCITFWNGMIEPSPSYLDRIRDLGLQWPIAYETDEDGLPPQMGTLAGVYYNRGHEWQPAGAPVLTNVHDFPTWQWGRRFRTASMTLGTTTPGSRSGRTTTPRCSQ